MIIKTKQLPNTQKCNNLRHLLTIGQVIPNHNSCVNQYHFRMSSFFINTKKSSMKYFDNLPSIEKIWGKGNPDYDGTLSIVVVGASGNLAMLKVSEY